MEPSLLRHFFDTYATCFHLLTTYFQQSPQWTPCFHNNLLNEPTYRLLHLNHLFAPILDHLLYSPFPCFFAMLLFHLCQFHQRKHISNNLPLWYWWQHQGITKLHLMIHQWSSKGKCIYLSLSLILSLCLLDVFLSLCMRLFTIFGLIRKTSPSLTSMEKILSCSPYQQSDFVLWSCGPVN